MWKAQVINSQHLIGTGVCMKWLKIMTFSSGTAYLGVMRKEKGIEKNMLKYD